MNDTTEPPSFKAATTRRQRARAAGLDPNHWYAVEYTSRLRPGRVVETRFWGRSIAIFRGADGCLGALENRCAHRQVKLSLGTVEKCELVCPYHGWRYARDGAIRVPPALTDRTVAALRITTFPVRERYGLVWIFPGRPEQADTMAMPEIPEIEGPLPWSAVYVDFTWAAHHSMIIENVSDFSHAYLHRRYRPFSDAKLIELETQESQVRLTYDVSVGDGRFSKHFVDRRRVKVDRMKLGFDYPYQWSNTGDRIKHWCFFLPIDARTTRVFFIFYFDAVKVPLLGIAMPRWLQRPMLHLARRLLLRPLLSQDGWMVEAEQQAYQQAPQARSIELNPAVVEFQKVMIARWQRYLDSVTHDSEKTGATMSCVPV